MLLIIADSYSKFIWYSCIFWLFCCLAIRKLKQTLAMLDLPYKILSLAMALPSLVKSWATFSRLGRASVIHVFPRVIHQAIIWRNVLYKPWRLVLLKYQVLILSLGCPVSYSTIVKRTISQLDVLRLSCGLIIAYALVLILFTLTLRKRSYASGFMSVVAQLVPHHSTLVTLFGHAISCCSTIGFWFASGAAILSLLCVLKMVISGSDVLIIYKSVVCENLLAHM